MFCTHLLTQHAGIKQKFIECRDGISSDWGITLCWTRRCIKTLSTRPCMCCTCEIALVWRDACNVASAWGLRSSHSGRVGDTHSLHLSSSETFNNCKGCELQFWVSWALASERREAQVWIWCHTTAYTMRKALNDVLASMFKSRGCLRCLKQDQFLSFKLDCLLCCARRSVSALFHGSLWLPHEKVCNVLIFVMSCIWERASTCNLQPAIVSKDVQLFQPATNLKPLSSYCDIQVTSSVLLGIAVWVCTAYRRLSQLADKAELAKQIMLTVTSVALLISTVLQLIYIVILNKVIVDLNAAPPLLFMLGPPSISLSLAVGILSIWWVLGNVEELNSSSGYVALPVTESARDDLKDNTPILCSLVQFHVQVKNAGQSKQDLLVTSCFRLEGVWCQRANAIAFIKLQLLWKVYLHRSGRSVVYERACIDLDFVLACKIMCHSPRIGMLKGAISTVSSCTQDSTNSSKCCVRDIYFSFFVAWLSKWTLTSVSWCSLSSSWKGGFSTLPPCCWSTVKG